MKTKDCFRISELKTNVLLDEARAGGRIPLIIGRGLTQKARETLNLGPSDIFKSPVGSSDAPNGFTLAQKMVGRACGVEGVLPGSYCEPKMTTVGSQDTTGPMTRDELKDLACLGFSADLVMQSFCHTAAYPKPVDIETQHSLPDFIHTREVVFRLDLGWDNTLVVKPNATPGHRWNRWRFAYQISNRNFFPSRVRGWWLAAATGVMPLDMPESVLVRFKGEMQPGITLRDLVNAIPYAALKSGDLTIEKKGKKNIFSGRILEIEGLPNLKVEQAFEISDASAERSAGGCTIRLDKEPIIEYFHSNITMLRWMIDNGYQDLGSLSAGPKRWKSGWLTRCFWNLTQRLNILKLLKLI